MTGEVLFGWFDDEVPMWTGNSPRRWALMLELGNGRATYRIIDEDSGELTLELVEGEVS